MGSFTVFHIFAHFQGSKTQYKKIYNMKLQWYSLEHMTTANSPELSLLKILQSIYHHAQPILSWQLDFTTFSPCLFYIGTTPFYSWAILTRYGFFCNLTWAFIFTLLNHRQGNLTLLNCIRNDLTAKGWLSTGWLDSTCLLGWLTAIIEYVNPHHPKNTFAWMATASLDWITIEFILEHQMRSHDLAKILKEWKDSW